MLSRNLGRVTSSHRGDCITAGEDVEGHVIACQYEHVRPGSYRVDFDIALTGPHNESSHGADDVLVVIDIAAAGGAAILARQEVARRDLQSDVRTFQLNLMLREFRSLEYRVYVTGHGEVKAWEPRLVKLTSQVEPWPPTDPDRDTNDPVELGRQARATLRLLEPRAAIGRTKIRLGNVGDGGYVSLDDFRPGDIALSLGINDDISWDLDAADRGLTIHQFDHTVDDPAPDDARMIFQKKMIASTSTDHSQSLPDLIGMLDRKEARPNLVLKMDIEGSEWDVWDATPQATLARFSQIFCEVHWLDQLSNTDRRRQIHRCFKKLHDHYAVVHVHGNSCGGLANVGGVVFPNVLEISFANRLCYDFSSTDELFPGPLDCSCDAYSPDLYLGSFKF